MDSTVTRRAIRNAYVQLQHVYLPIAISLLQTSSVCNSQVHDKTSLFLICSTFSSFCCKEVGKFLSETKDSFACYSQTGLLLLTNTLLDSFPPVFFTY